LLVGPRDWGACKDDLRADRDEGVDHGLCVGRVVLEVVGSAERPTVGVEHAWRHGVPAELHDHDAGCQCDRVVRHGIEPIADCCAPKGTYDDLRVGVIGEGVHEEVLGLPCERVTVEHDHRTGERPDAPVFGREPRMVRASCWEAGLGVCVVGGFSADRRHRDDERCGHDRCGGADQAHQVDDDVVDPHPSRWGVWPQREVEAAVVGGRSFGAGCFVHVAHSLCVRRVWRHCRSRSWNEPGSRPPTPHQLHPPPQSCWCSFLHLGGEVLHAVHRQFGPSHPGHRR
jgi:hypothetical protein